MADAQLEARIARLEAQSAIRELAARYALAIDTRNLGLLADLYVPDMPGEAPWGDGGEGEATRIGAGISRYYRSFHQIVGQTINLTSPMTAGGTVYCKAEHEFGDRWVATALCYIDQYVLHEGRWLFAARRQLHKLYNADMGRGPVAPYTEWPGTGAPAPDPRVTWPKIAPSWAEYWAQVPDEDIARITTLP